MKLPDLFHSMYDLSGYTLGAPQRSGILTLLPILSTDAAENLVAQLMGLRRFNSRMNLPHQGDKVQDTDSQIALQNSLKCRFELQTGQTGAVFFLAEYIFGIEIAPTSAYFADIWTPLLRLCDGAAGEEKEEMVLRLQTDPIPFPADSIGDIRSQLSRSRRERLERMLGQLEGLSREKFSDAEAERYLNMRLKTLVGKNYAGQYVEATEPSSASLPIEESKPSMIKRLFRSKSMDVKIREEKYPVYLSLFARADYLIQIRLAAQAEGNRHLT